MLSPWTIGAVEEREKFVVEALIRLVASSLEVKGRMKPVVGSLTENSGLAPVTLVEDKMSGRTVIVISHGYWTRRFKQDPSALGREILINGTKLSIIGIAPEDFTGEIVGQSPPRFDVPAKVFGRRSARHS